MKKVYIIGIGMNGAETLTQQAKQIIGEADCLIGANRMLEPFSALNKPGFISWNSGDISDYIQRSEYDTFAVLMSGDCGFFSGSEGLLRALPESVDSEVVCGISTPVYFCSKLKIPWQDIPTVNLHGVSSNIARNAARYQRCFFLLGGKLGASEVCRRLCDYGMGGINVYIGECLGYPHERILTGKAEMFINTDLDNLSVLMTDNTEPELFSRSGIPDGEFIRGEVPMTKSEVRALAISKLGIAPADVVWDIGCGTGSVSVEMALQCYNGRVYSVDKKPEAVALTRQNAVKFRCDNIESSWGTAPECLDELPAPDKVFIGGTCGNLNAIIKSISDKNHNAVVVLTAVSLETLNEAIKTLTECKYEYEILQISVTRTKLVGSHTMLNAENPVFIIKGAKKCVES